MLHFHGLFPAGDSLLALAAPVEQLELAVTGRSGLATNGGRVGVTGEAAAGSAAPPVSEAALLSLCKWLTEL
jgi:hypothetical protein